MKIKDNKYFENVYIHETAYIDENVQIGHSTKIWHFSHILKNCKIGNNCSFGQNVVVGADVTIGNHVKIQNNVSIYEGVTLEDGVFCGPSCVFTNVYNPRSYISRKNEYRQTIVKEGATLGANCTIVCGVTIGSFSFIGAGALVNKNIPPYALVMGVPAKQVGWVSEYGEKLDLPLKGNQLATCQYTKQKYQLKNEKVFRVGKSEN